MEFIKRQEVRRLDVIFVFNEKGQYEKVLESREKI